MAAHPLIACTSTVSPPVHPALSALSPKHQAALTQALAWLPSIAAPVGVVAAGSVVRGLGGPSSDLDLVVLQEAEGRQRVQKLFNGVPFELFFHSAVWLEHVIHSEAAEGRPVMAHMMATGVVVLDTSGQMAAMQQRAKEVLRKGYAPSEVSLVRSRYAAATLVEDALDFQATDSPDARRMRALATEALITYAFMLNRQFLPRPKERLAVLAQMEPRLAGGLALALSAPSAAVANSALRNAAQQILGAEGFFEWSSPVELAVPLPQ